MHLTIVSPDLVQAHVLAGAAQRRGWIVSYYASIDSCIQAGAHADAFIADFERVDAAVCSQLSRLADRVGSSRLFLLAEEVCGVLPTEEALSARLVLKPFHPPELVRLIDASIPRPKRKAAPTARPNVKAPEVVALSAR
ncbi:MAG: hypothetical protein M0R75_03210 [Dehalococcoidia bacterium]|nr:hypothetical protein [Dehalococcoidia bacterium]